MPIQGIIRPPPEIRAVADKTALYVAKNGRAFEAKILNSGKGKTPKFSFLQQTSPFHAYYEDRLSHYEEVERNGGVNNEEASEAEAKASSDTDSKSKKVKEEPEEAKKDEPNKQNKTETNRKAAILDPIAKTMLRQSSKIAKARAEREEEEKKKKENSEDPNGDDFKKTASLVPALPPPPPLELMSIIAPSNLSTVQIETIQLVAQFAAMDGKGGSFLPQLTMSEWTNPDFAFCQPRHAHFAYFSALVDAYRRIISMLTSSVSGAAPKDTEIKISQDDIQKELEHVAYRAEYEREMKRLRSENDQEKSEMLAIDWHDFVVVETIDFPVDEAVEMSMLPPPPPPPKVKPTTPTAAAKPDGDDGTDESDDDDEPIRVVPSYTPNVVAASDRQIARAIDPITGKSVAVDDMPEHLRIQLLDPKWAEERKKFQDKQKDSNLVSGDAIANNISRFAQARGDFFGKSEQELLSNAQDSKKRLEEANRVIREQASLPQPLPVPPPPSVTMPPPPPVGAAGSVRKFETSSAMEPPPKRTRIVAPPVDQQSIIPSPASPPPTVFDPIAAMTSNEPATEADSSGTSLLSEAEFAASLSKPEVTLQIRIPNDPSQTSWNFFGQILSMSVDVMSKVKQVKKELSKTHLNDMPPNKIQFKSDNAFLKDSSTLASLNIGPTATLEMVPKTRGGRR